MNIVALLGRLTADPELRYTTQGVSVTTFTLAVDRPQKDADADFPTIVAWRQTAEFVCRYLHKGSRVAISGELHTRNYSGQDGKSHKITEIYADRVEFADSPQR